MSLKSFQVENWNYKILDKSWLVYSCLVIPSCNYHMLCSWHVPPENFTGFYIGKIRQSPLLWLYMLTNALWCMHSKLLRSKINDYSFLNRSLLESPWKVCLRWGWSTHITTGTLSAWIQTMKQNSWLHTGQVMYLFPVPLCCSSAPHFGQALV